MNISEADYQKLSAENLAMQERLTVLSGNLILAQAEVENSKGAIAQLRGELFDANAKIADLERTIAGS